MPLTPLRQRRLDYIKSVPVNTSGASTERNFSLNPIDWLEAIGDMAETAIFGKPQGPTYHVTLAEQKGAEKISWIEKATQRDFKIGVSLGSLAFLSLTAATGGALAFGPGMLVAAGALIGGLSDYTRNTEEMTKGVDIGPARHINRDAVKTALGWGFGIKLALTVGAVALAAAGAPVFGLGATWAAAAAGGAGVMGQVGAVAQTIPAVLGAGSFIAGGLFGAIRGSEQGYQRMAREYKAAKIKSERPELGVSVTQEPSLNAPDLALNVIAPVVTAGMVAGVGSQMARMEQQDKAVPEPIEFNTARIHASQQKAIPIAHEMPIAKNEIVPFIRVPEGGFAQREMERRGGNAERGIEPEQTAGMSFVQRQQERQQSSSSTPEFQLV